MKASQTNKGSRTVMAVAKTGVYTYQETLACSIITGLIPKVSYTQSGAKKIIL